MDSQDSLWLARESGLEHRTMGFRGRATTSLGIREGFLYEVVFEDVWDLKVKADCVCFLFCYNKSSQTQWL